MKRFGYILIGLLVGVLATIGIVINNDYFKEDESSTEGNTNSMNVSPDSVAMMLETGVSSGQYSYSNSSEWPDESEYTFNSEASKCENGSTLTWDSDTKQVVMTGTKSDKCYAYFDRVGIDMEFNYTGDEQTYTVERAGYYKLEVWGASGADATATFIGGYGGYSIGTVYLEEGETLYINVGGEGGTYTYATSTASTAIGGYNGGGYGHVTSSVWPYRYLYAGGGATHIATVSGLLSTLEDNQDTILIVAGGGGSGSAQRGNSTLQSSTSNYFIYNYSFTLGGSGGGYIGNSMYVVSRYWNESAKSIYDQSILETSTSTVYYSTGGSQTSGGKHYMSGGSTNNAGFGYGSLLKSDITSSSVRWGGGGGFYGGEMGAGGSGYIGNSLLTDKAMYCYECSESTDTDTYTVSTTNVSSDAISMYAKDGNGYAKITYISE